MRKRGLCLSAATGVSEVKLPVSLSDRTGCRYLLGIGRSADAIEQSTLAQIGDPLDVFARTQLVVALEVRGELDRVDAGAEQVRRMAAAMLPG